uniref:Uncharacterized protein n=1 Tax=Peronospora matthiolae TaxID=2874970 RepID=A0AAV1TNQ6_9STRA
MDADVNAIEIDDDNAGIFSIAKDCHSEDDDALTGEDNVVSALQTKCNAVDRMNQQRNFCCFAKRLSASFKTLLQMH